MNNIDYNILSQYHYNGDDPLQYEDAFYRHPNSTDFMLNGSTSVNAAQSYTDPGLQPPFCSVTMPPRAPLQLTSITPFMTSMAGNCQPPTIAHAATCGVPKPSNMVIQESEKTNTEAPCFVNPLPILFGSTETGTLHSGGMYDVEAPCNGDSQAEEMAPAEGNAKTYYISKYSHRKKLETERKRRKALCSAYGELRSVLPPAAQRGFKCDAMAAAAEEIRRLRAEVQQCKQSGTCPHHCNQIVSS